MLSCVLFICLKSIRWKHFPIAHQHLYNLYVQAVLYPLCYLRSKRNRNLGNVVKCESWDHFHFSIKGDEVTKGPFIRFLLGKHLPIRDSHSIILSCNVLGLESGMLVNILNPISAYRVRIIFHSLTVVSISVLSSLPCLLSGKLLGSRYVQSIR